MPTKSNRPSGLRLRSWLVLSVLIIGLIFHRPLIGVVVAVLLAASMLVNYLQRRKQRNHA